MFDVDPIPQDPAGYGEVDDAEFLSKKVRAADLVGVALEVFDPFAQSGCLKFRGLGVEQAEVARHNVFVNEIDPDPGLGGLVGISGPQGVVLGVSIFEELEDDLRIVKWFALICDSGD